MTHASQTIRRLVRRVFINGLIRVLRPTDEANMKEIGGRVG